jgi:adenosylcobinamide kinase/adenosylcobinamide-phosphate guanylyltransferase
LTPKTWTGKSGWLCTAIAAPPTGSCEKSPWLCPQAVLSATGQDCLLIDSLGTWLANLLEQDDDTWRATVQTLVESLQQTPSTVILVSEETGWGVVPAYPIGRLFRDRLGYLTRQVGTVADAVYLVVAGYAVDVKRLGRGIGGPND